MEQLCFKPGRTCVHDFLEILFLAINGYDLGAAKLVRDSMKEGGNSLPYQESEKAERFFRFAAIQEYKITSAALRALGEEAVNDALQPKTSVASVREAYETVKAEFQITLCKTCGDRRTAFSWDLDIASMAKEVGAPLLRTT
jgi:hypothetical protein